MLMSQFYSDRSRESDLHSLPDVETFRANYAYCSRCGSLVFRAGDSGVLQGICSDCETPAELVDRGWFYWYCLPGCLPDSEPFGPFKTERVAIRDARANS